MECSDTVLPVIGKDKFIENKANSPCADYLIKNLKYLDFSKKIYIIISAQ